MPRARAGSCGPILCSCSAQEWESPAMSVVAVIPAGAMPSIIAVMMRGDTKASRARWRMWRSAFPSRSAMSAKLWPRATSLTHLRALAMAISKVSRPPGFIGLLCAGTWTMPLAGTAAGTFQGMVTFGRAGGFAVGDLLAQVQRDRLAAQRRPQQMPLDELAIGFENGVGSGAVCLQVAANGIDHQGLQLRRRHPADRSRRLLSQPRL